MDHIPTTRLKNLYRDGVVLNEKDAKHLKSCEICSMMLQKFAEQRAKSLEAKDKEDLTGHFGKSA